MRFNVMQYATIYYDVMQYDMLSYRTTLQIRGCKYQSILKRLICYDMI